MEGYNEGSPIPPTARQELAKTLRRYRVDLEAAFESECNLIDNLLLEVEHIPPHAVQALRLKYGRK